MTIVLEYSGGVPGRVFELPGFHTPEKGNQTRQSQ